MQRILPSVIATAAALALSAPAWAKVEQVSARVSYADLDIGHPAGRQILERRVSRAATTICRDPSPFTPMRLIKACRAEALASARPQLLALYEARPLTEPAVVLAARMP
ncbi:UrcA family protein [Phenylobacterium terrae]|uniref:UrcA family protein n=1 Tax=Phenylobacterium terrae TaxID=2665495 RepID=A0ABW4MZT7_9CAUL